MNSIPFSKNWNNKLHCDVFTTIRKDTPEKRAYYESQLGKVLAIRLNKGEYCRRKLVNIDRALFREITLSTVATDVGFSDKVKIKELFQKLGITLDTPVLVLLLEKVEVM